MCPYVSNFISSPQICVASSSDSYFFRLNFWPTALTYLGNCKDYQLFIVPSTYYTYDWPHVRVDRYSNTLLVSLNNRISFRDANCAPEGKSFNPQVVSSPINSNSAGVTMETFVMENEMSQKYPIGRSAEVDESESHDAMLWYPISYDWAIRSCGCRHRVMLI